MKKLIALMENLNADTELYRTLITAVVGFLGVLIGIVITTIVNWKIKTKETRLRILEKLYDKRLNAHENLLKVPKFLRTTVNTKEIDGKNIMVTYPGILNDKETFDNFLGQFYEIVNFNSHWFGNDLRKELWFAQEYLQNIDRYYSQIPPENCIEFAKIVKFDFIKLADIIEERTLEFLQTDIQKINEKPIKKDSEYSSIERNSKLSDTDLFKNINKVLELKK